MFSLVASIAVAVDPHGDIIPTLDSTRAEGDDFRWNHTVNVTADQAVEPGDYFTIHDFGNLIPGLNVQPAGWSFTSLLVGTTLGTVPPTADPNVFNLTWTYTC